MTQVASKVKCPCCTTSMNNLEKFIVDEIILASRINPANCEIVHVSGNSMSPEYCHGDRVIIDLSVKKPADGHIFAFRYMGATYVKEFNCLGGRIKCISLNKEYESFYIEKGEDFEIFGKIIPRVRL